MVRNAEQQAEAQKKQDWICFESAVKSQRFAALRARPKSKADRGRLVVERGQLNIDLGVFPEACRADFEASWDCG